MEWIQETEGIWTYIVLFLLAAAPWLEVFLVIPVGVAMGLNPVAVAITGFVGNWIPILLIVLFFKKLSAWRARRKERQRIKQAGYEQATGEHSVLEHKVSEGSLAEPQEVPHVELQEELQEEQHVEAHEEPQEEPRGKKQQRARKLWEKYGIPGFCLLAPALVGTDIAMILGLAFGSPRRPLFIWMTISLFLWTIILTVLTMQGINLFT